MRFNDRVSPTQSLVVAGRIIAVFEPTDIHDRPTVEDVEVRVPLDEAVPLLLSELSGHYLVSSDHALLDALIAAGASVARHAHVYTHELDDVDPAWQEPAISDRMRVTSADRPARDLVDVEFAAYPAEHPDHEHDDRDQVEAFVQQVLDGVVVGPFMPEASGLVLDDDRPVALLLVNRMSGDPPLGGPWVTDVARDPGPRYRGLGAALIRRSLAVLQDAGEPSLGLAVTDGNPAAAVYEELGFRRVSSARRLLLP